MRSILSEILLLIWVAVALVGFVYQTLLYRQAHSQFDIKVIDPETDVRELVILKSHIKSASKRLFAFLINLIIGLISFVFSGGFVGQLLLIALIVGQGILVANGRSDYRARKFLIEELLKENGT